MPRKKSTRNQRICFFSPCCRPHCGCVTVDEWNEHKLERVYSEGSLAQKNNVSRSDNPYDNAMSLGKEWERGWYDAAEKRKMSKELAG